MITVVYVVCSSSPKFCLDYRQLNTLTPVGAGKVHALLVVVIYWSLVEVFMMSCISSLIVWQI